MSQVSRLAAIGARSMPGRSAGAVS